MNDRLQLQYINHIISNLTYNCNYFSPKSTKQLYDDRVNTPHNFNRRLRRQNYAKKKTKTLYIYIVSALCSVLKSTGFFSTAGCNKVH